MSKAGPASPPAAGMPSPMARFPSSTSTSTIGGLSPSGSPAMPRTTSRTAVPGKRRRNLLRDYYGLDQGASPAGRDPLNVDSPTFDPKAYYDHLSNTLTLPELLKRETELLGEIRELDSERQSLVYNHHHELIEASDTIRKMKARAESLDGALDGLTAALETITQLSESLAANPPPPSKLPPPDASTSFDPLLHLPPLLGLPCTLRSLLGTSSPERIRDGLLPNTVNAARRRATSSVSTRDDAAMLWGQWEPCLRAWEDEGVQGVREVADECRAILARARRGSGTVHR